MDIADQLVWSAGDGDVIEVARLLGQGAVVDAPSRDGRTAVEQGYADVVRQLVIAGADLDQQAGEYRESTPLCLAASRGHTAVVGVLLDAGVRTGAQGQMGWVPLVLAATAGDEGYLARRRTKQRRFGGLSTDTFGISSAQNGGPLMGACGMIANMSEPELDLFSRLWDEHKRATFPPHLRGQDIEGEDMVMLDADIAGCVSSSLSGPLDERRRSILLRCLAALEKVVPSISDEGGAVEYYERLREMAALATESGNAKAQ